MVGPKLSWIVYITKSLFTNYKFQIEPERINKSVSSPRDFFEKLYGPPSNREKSVSPHSNAEVPSLQTALNNGTIPPTSAPTSLLAPMPAYPGAYLPYHAMAGSGPDPGAMFRFDGFHLPGGLAAFCK